MKAGDFGDRFPAAGYIRLSREDGDREESDSVMNQKKLIQSFLASREDLELEGFMWTTDLPAQILNAPVFKECCGISAGERSAAWW